MKRAYSAVILAALLAGSEVALRWTGHTPYRLPKVAIQYQPPHCFLPARLSGVELNPGTYLVTLNGGLVYRATHNTRHERVTGLVEKDSHLPEVALLGDSMTYGMGVDDAASYPFLVNAELAEARVTNLAIPGTGTVHSYLRLKEYLRLGNRPAVVVLNFVEFHDDRNVYGYQTRDMLRAGTRGAADEAMAMNKNAPWTYAYARLRGNSVDIAEQDLHPLARWAAPLRTAFALANLVDQAWDHWAYRRAQPEEVTNRLVGMADQLCQQYGCRFFVSLMSRGQRTEELRAYCRRQEIGTVDISVDFGQRRFTNYPFDSHPSPLAHQSMAVRLKDLLSQAISGSAEGLGIIRDRANSMDAERR